MAVVKIGELLTARLLGFLALPLQVEEVGLTHQPCQAMLITLQ